MDCDLCGKRIRDKDARYTVEVHGNVRECTKIVCENCKDYINTWYGSGIGD